ncbi:MAG: hypothetical protein KGH66_00445 [Candidatus Micrarchaeota archaeon]|nr:hypothetical protein [Candidatus Micrarchaeota archaeon]
MFEAFKKNGHKSDGKDATLSGVVDAVEDAYKSDKSSKRVELLTNAHGEFVAIKGSIRKEYSQLVTMMTKLGDIINTSKDNEVVKRAELLRIEVNNVARTNRHLDQGQ